MSANRIQPQGGRRTKLTDLLVDGARAAELKTASKGWASWDLTDRQVCDLELLLNGGFSPLTGFMNQADYDAVGQTSRLADGTLWPVPVVLDLPEALASTLAAGSSLALRDGEGVMLAVLQVEDVWTPDLSAVGQDRHPCLVGGRLEGLQLPHHNDFRSLRKTPAELRQAFAAGGWDKVIALHPEDVMHRAEYTWTLRTAQELGAHLLIHPPVGGARVADLDHYTRVNCLEAIRERYPKDLSVLSLLPLLAGGAGPREAILRAIVSRNYGCTHTVVAEESAEILASHATELGVEAITSKTLVYAKDRGAYVAQDELTDDSSVLKFSDSDLRQRLSQGGEIPDGFTFPEIARALERRYPPRHKQGFTVFFTGLSGSGKSTVANLLLTKCLELGGRSVTLLDGDLVRKNLSSELTFSKEHRNINIRRIGYVASEITKNGGIAICAPIAPYARVRQDVQNMIEPLGGFILVHVDTPLEVCEQRDRKGLYAKARAGLIKEFTGISDPYERPEHPNLRLSTTERSADQLAEDVLLYLQREGYVSAGEGDED